MQTILHRGFEVTYDQNRLVEAKQNGERVSDGMHTYLENHPQFRREVEERLGMDSVPVFDPSE